MILYSHALDGPQKPIPSPRVRHVPSKAAFRGAVHFGGVMAKERWKAIPGWAGYEVSNIGKVRSYRRHERRIDIPLPHPVNGTIKRGYHMVFLRSPKKRAYVAVHRLVLLAFVGLPPRGQECCHCDGNSLNNNLVNLRWDTSAANAKDRERHGRTAKGESAGRSKLTNRNVLHIRKSGESAAKLSAKYGVREEHVNKIRKGLAWKHLSL